MKPAMRGRKIWQGETVWLQPSMPPTPFKEAKAIIIENGGQQTITRTKNCYCVFHDFKGDEFTRARSSGNTILGLDAFLQYSKKGEKPKPESIRFNSLFENVVFTLVEPEESDLGSYGEWMGGIQNKSITSDTTHLITYTNRGEAYQMAGEGGIPIVTLEWLKDCWEKKTMLDHHLYLLPPLLDCTITITNIPKEYEFKIVELGGVYLNDLTKKTTHLVLKLPFERNKKYEYALQWGKSIVSLDWIQQSIARRHRLDEQQFTVHSGSSRRSDVHREDQFTVNSNSDPLDNVRLTSDHGRKSASRMEDPMDDRNCVIPSSQVVSKPAPTGLLHGVRIFFSQENLKEQHTSHVKRRGGTVEDQLHTEVNYYIIGSQRSNELLPIVRYLNSSDGKLCSVDNLPFYIVTLKWLMDSIKENQIYPVDPYQWFPEPEEWREAQNEISMNTTDYVGMEADVDPNDDATLNYSPIRCSNIFSDLQFLVQRLYPIERRDELRRKISLHGGFVLDDIHNIKCYTHVIVGHGEDVEDVKSELWNVLNHEPPPVVSVEYVERCIEEGIKLEEDSSILYRPLPFHVPYPSMSGVSVAHTNFPVKERKNLSLLVHLLGGKCYETLNRENTHLVCYAPRGIKYDRAMRWHIKTVTYEWIVQCVKSGRKVPEEPYLMDASYVARDDDMDTNRMSSQVNSHDRGTKMGGRDAPVLPGVTIYCSKRIPPANAERLHQMITALGGTYSSTSKEITHLIYEGRGDPYKENSTKSRKVHVVSPLWVEKSFETRMRQPETDYPHTLHSKMNLVTDSPSQYYSSPNVRYSNASLSPPTPMVSKKRIVSDPSSSSKRRKSETSGSTWDEVIRKQSVKDEKKRRESGSAITEDSNRSRGRREEIDMEVDRPKETMNQVERVKEVELKEKDVEDLPLGERLGRKELDTEVNPVEKYAIKGTSTAQMKWNESVEVNEKKIHREPTMREEEQEVEPIEEIAKEEENKKTEEEMAAENRENLRKLLAGLSRPTEFQKPKRPKQKIGQTKQISPTWLEEEEEDIGLEDNNSNDRPEETSSPPKEYSGTQNDEDSASSQVAVYAHREELNHRAKLREKIEQEETPKGKGSSGGPKASPKKSSSSQKPKEPEGFNILISNAETKNKKKYEQCVEQLGGKIVTGNEDPPIFTHVVACGEPTPSMKCLSAIAAGRWLLKDSWLLDSHKQGQFLPEEQYEWAPCDCVRDQTMKLCESAQESRRKFQLIRQKNSSGQVGKLSGKKLIFDMVLKSQEQQWITIAKSGGATVVPFGNNISGVTEYISDGKTFQEKYPKGQLDHIVKARIPCCEVTFLRVLLSEPDFSSLSKHQPYDLLAKYDAANKD
ncbi:DNA topoisomerase 2-binding protein 1-A-like [Planoprotostelium fungivorum]|uniref:DNA topoisomerase 2-binding protein 1-A-like n=1 Tax=Planoprotostelium fungivorum TaxID=1890364 RepID=A0A2P6N8Y7_9EUKA|nr:DNA topoisomerase 2-binding protein 1-A-like [Planoprotostelium fungivorum]